MLRAAAACLTLGLALGLAGCAPTGPAGPTVVASFYPLQFVAQRIVGEHARVENLTAPGVEPHDLELTVRQTAEVSAATAVLYEQELQPSVDQAVTNNRPAHVLDTTSVVPLRGDDPHFWQDPTLLADVARAFTRTMVAADPAHAADFRANDRRLQQDLRRLDAAYRQGLAHCRTRTLVVSHDAFEYLGRRYHLQVHAIAGLSPDAEPSPSHLQQLAGLIRRDGITTVFSERLASPQMADTLATDLGIHTAVLDTLEGLTSSDPHANYLSIMRANLTAIRKADSCS
ncbi:MAG TPA: metal ABC transporter substrate-binding protein [Marmoricola sp.]|nr:metal ABC transporter substrate-binding protein [Marmoricola sp.]